MQRSICFYASVFLFVLVCLEHPVMGQEPQKPSVTAAPLMDQKIILDGVLNEAVWDTAEPAKDFVQQRPDVGLPALGISSVRVVYDEASLYIGAILNDSNPEKIRGDELHRDAAMNRSDAFAVLIDTYHDHQAGFFFETNILSARADALVGQEGGLVNRDWNGVWEVAAQPSSTGWSVELRIPFETLRFRPGEAQTWGIQFRRKIPHLKETSFWSPLSAEQSFFEISRSGHLLGMEASRQKNHLFLKPYLKGAYEYARTDTRDGWDSDEDVGLDLRYHFKTNLTLDLTFNTDFAEAEVDRFQVNLTRFPLFFPEKREFFLEGKGFYAFGLSGRVQPFFSRQIGLVQRAPVPIAGGGKLTGKVGPYGFGLLLMQTKAEGDSVQSPAEQFGVVRLSRDIGVRSNVGLIATHRAERNNSGGQTLGIDTTIAPNSNLVADAFWLRSGGENKEESGQAVYGVLRWRDPFWRITAWHLRIDEQFAPTLGFVPQADLSESYGNIDIRPKPERGAVREFGFKGELTYQTDTGGDFLYRSNYWRGQVDFKSGDFVLLSVDPQAERLPDDFDIRPGIAIPSGTYRYTDYNIYYNSDPRRSLSTVVSYLWGGFYTGERRRLSLSLVSAPLKGLKLGAGWNADWVRLPQGNFVAQIFKGDINWALTNRVLLQALFQWNKEDKVLAANLRFSWEYRPGSRIYLIANPFHQGNDNTVLFLAKVTWRWEPYF